MDDIRTLVDDAVRDVHAERDALERTMRRVGFRSRNRRLRAAGTALLLAGASTTILWATFVAEKDDAPAAPESERIVFVTGSPTGPGPMIAVMAPDGSGVRVLGPGSEPAWSPDGTRIAFTDTTADGSTGVFVMDADGTDVRRLTTNPSGMDESPSWSPDGSRIVFSRSTFVTTTPDPVATRARRDLYTIGSDGTGLAKLIGGPTDDFGPQWSPDGSRLGFVRFVDPASQGPEGTPQVWVLRLDGSEPEEQLTELEGGTFRFAWSPDAARLVLDAGCKVHVVEVDGGAVSEVTFGPVIQCPWDPSWSPDGTKIVFAAGPDEDHDIFVANADGTRVVRLTGPAGHDNQASWWGLPAGDDPGRSDPPTSPAATCFESESSADFDGDGRIDTATLHAIVPFGRCTPAALETDWRFELAVELGSGAVSVPFLDCPSLFDCELLEGSDFDGDGRSELPVALSMSATSFTGVYRVTDEGVHPIEVAPPGDPGYLEPGVVRFGGGQDAIQRAGFDCLVREDGSTVVIAWMAEREDALSPFSVHRTILELRGDQFIVIAADDQRGVIDLPATHGLCTNTH